MKNSKRKVGDIAIPKSYPHLRGEITEVKAFLGETLYRVLGGLYTESELEPVKEPVHNG